MNFIFSNIFNVIFCTRTSLQEDYNPRTFLTRIEYLYTSISRFFIEKLPLITGNGDIFSYKW